MKVNIIKHQLFFVFFIRTTIVHTQDHGRLRETGKQRLEKKMKKGIPVDKKTSYCLMIFWSSPIQLFLFPV
jgi:hypothetical protein